MRWSALLLVTACLGCNAILGIEEGTLDLKFLDAGKDAGSSGCLLNSDCKSREVCIFRVCSQPCKEDLDCVRPLQCLRTADATACVNPPDSRCQRMSECPDGTRCTDGACRTTCDQATEAHDCLDGQSCVAGGCRSAVKDGGVLRDAGSDGDIGDGSIVADAAASDGGGTGGTGTGGSNEPIDACAQDNGGCDPSVDCVSNKGIATCGDCPKGYEYGSGDRSKCNDIDECSPKLGGGDCDPDLGICTNTSGSHTCACKPGSYGTGKVCTLNKICSNSADCAPEATCEIAGALEVCICGDGYTGDGATCTPVDCGAPSAPTNGSVLTPDGTTYSKVATYSCDKGYVMSDGPSRTCQADTSWSVPAPTCAPVDCGAPSAPMNGSVLTPGGTTYLQVATYSCNAGYTLTGSSTQPCAETGFWSGSAPTCPDTLECKNPLTCDANATCTEATGSYSCACNCGYAGSGMSCSPSVINLGNAPNPAVFTSSISLAGGNLYGYRIQGVQAANLLNFGLVSRSNGVSARFALYTNSGSVPGTLVFQSGAGIPISVGTNLALSSSPCQALSSGDYWVFVIANVVFDVASRTGGTEPSTCYVTSFGYGTAFPTTFPGCSVAPFPSNAFNLYVVTD